MQIVVDNSLVFVASMLAAVAFVVGVRRASSRPLQNGRSAISAFAVLGAIAAATFVVWGWVWGVIAEFAWVMWVAPHHGCVPDPPDPAVMAIVIFVPSALWCILTRSAFGVPAMGWAPLVGGACAWGTVVAAGIDWDRPGVFGLGAPALAWVVPQIVMGTVLIRRPTRPGTCARCGYSRTGLPPGAMCPECGAAPGQA